jgi:hypothetical protein
MQFVETCSGESCGKDWAVYIEEEDKSRMPIEGVV